MTNVVDALDGIVAGNETVPLAFHADEELILERRIEEDRKVGQREDRGEVLEQNGASSIEDVERGVRLFYGIRAAGLDFAAITAIEIHVNDTGVDARIDRAALVTGDSWRDRLRLVLNDPLEYLLHLDREQVVEVRPKWDVAGKARGPTSLREHLHREPLVVEGSDTLNAKDSGQPALVSRGEIAPEADRQIDLGSGNARRRTEALEVSARGVACIRADVGLPEDPRIKVEHIGACHELIVESEVSPIGAKRRIHLIAE